MLFSRPGFHCAVAEYESRIIGSACMDERSAICGIGPVSVAPDFQNRGVGRALMATMLDRVHQKGSRGVRLPQATFHNRSLGLYKRQATTGVHPTA